MVLKPGDRGPTVGELQTRLNRWLAHEGAGEDPLAESGYFDDATAQVVALFQQSIGRKATGWADSEVQRALGLSETPTVLAC